MEADKAPTPPVALRAPPMRPGVTRTNILRRFKRGEQVHWISAVLQVEPFEVEDVLRHELYEADVREVVLRESLQRRAMGMSP